MSSLQLAPPPGWIFHSSQIRATSTALVSTSTAARSERRVGLANRNAPAPSSITPRTGPQPDAAVSASGSVAWGSTIVTRSAAAQVPAPIARKTPRRDRQVSAHIAAMKASTTASVTA